MNSGSSKMRRRTISAAAGRKAAPQRPPVSAWIHSVMQAPITSPSAHHHAASQQASITRGASHPPEASAMASSKHARDVEMRDGPADTGDRNHRVGSAAGGTTACH